MFRLAHHYIVDRPILEFYYVRYTPQALNLAKKFKVIMIYVEKIYLDDNHLKVVNLGPIGLFSEISWLVVADRK